MGWELKTFKKEIDILGLHTFYYFEHPKHFYFPGERHDFWEMVYVDRGEIDVLAETTGYRLQQGDVIFHKPMEFHTLASNDRDPNNVLVVTFSARGEAVNYFENKLFTLDARHKKLLALMLDEGRDLFPDLSGKNGSGPPMGQAPLFGSSQLLLSYLEQFLILLIRSNRQSERSSRKSGIAKKNVENILVEHIREYLEKHVYGTVKLTDLCRGFNMSKSYLCQLFKEATGKSIIDYYIHLKTEEARQLIRKGEYNFTQISELLGYSGIHHFSRSFKQMTGFSPGYYAKSIIDAE